MIFLLLSNLEIIYDFEVYMVLLSLMPNH